MANLAYAPTSKVIELLKAADPKGEKVVCILSASKLGIGEDPRSPSEVIDLSTEAIRLASANEEAPHFSRSMEAPAPMKPIVNGQYSRHRTTGLFSFELDGQVTNCHTLKEMLLKGLQAIEVKYPGTLDKLSTVKKRTKRIVARTANDLFDSKHLVEDHSHKLPNGWWVGTNNSREEVGGWLKQAAELAGLQWQRDFRAMI